MDAYSSFHYGFICQMKSIGFDIIMLNHRGQAILSEGSKISHQSSLRIVPIDGFIEKVACSTQGMFLLVDIPLIQQSVDRYSLLQQEVDLLPNIVQDIMDKFNGWASGENAPPQSESFPESRFEIALKDCACPRVLEAYAAYQNFKITDIRGFTPSQTLGLLLCYLSRLEEPLFPSPVGLELAHKYSSNDLPYLRPAVLQKSLENLSPSSRQVFLRLVQILSICFTWGDSVESKVTKEGSFSSIGPPLLQETVDLIFSGMFGQHLEKNVDSTLRKVCFLFVRFSPIWSEYPIKDGFLKPIQFYLMEFKSSRLDLLDEFIEESAHLPSHRDLFLLLLDSSLLNRVSQKEKLPTL